MKLTDLLSTAGYRKYSGNPNYFKWMCEAAEKLEKENEKLKARQPTEKTAYVIMLNDSVQAVHFGDDESSRKLKDRLWDEYIKRHYIQDHDLDRIYFHVRDGIPVE